MSFDFGSIANMASGLLNKTGGAQQKENLDWKKFDIDGDGGLNAQEADALMNALNGGKSGGGAGGNIAGIANIAGSIFGGSGGGQGSGSIDVGSIFGQS